MEKGVTKSLEEGVLAGYPIVDLKVVLYDGSFHPVDSSGMSFEIAGSFALRQGMENGNPVLLEPIMRLQVTIPDAFTGEGLNDYPVALCGYFPDTGRCESDPVFMIFYLFRHTDEHNFPRQIGTVESGPFW